LALELERRVVRLLGITANPDGARVVRNFASDLDDAGRHFRLLIRDRERSSLPASMPCSPPSASRT